MILFKNRFNSSDDIGHLNKSSTQISMNWQLVHALNALPLITPCYIVMYFLSVARAWVSTDLGVGFSKLHFIFRFSIHIHIPQSTEDKKKGRVTPQSRGRRTPTLYGKNRRSSLQRAEDGESSDFTGRC